MRGGPLSTQSLHALAGRIDSRYLVVEEMIRVVLGGRSYSRHTCLTPDVGIPASTGRNVVSVGIMHPVIIRIVSFSATSSFLVWVLRHQAGTVHKG